MDIPDDPHRVAPPDDDKPERDEFEDADEAYENWKAEL